MESCALLTRSGITDNSGTSLMVQDEYVTAEGWRSRYAPSYGVSDT